MFALVFGALALVLGLIFRDWSDQAELVDDSEAAGMYALLSFLAFIAMIIFIVTGLVNA